MKMNQCKCEEQIVSKEIDLEIINDEIRGEIKTQYMTTPVNFNLIF